MVAKLGDGVLLASSGKRLGMLLKTLQYIRKPLSPTKNYLAINVSSAEAEKPCSNSCLLILGRLFGEAQVNFFTYVAQKNEKGNKIQ